MLKNLTRGRVIGAWFVTMALATVASLGFGAAATPGTWTLLFLIGLIPPAISLIVWRGAPPQTVAEVLYSVRQEDAR